MSDSTPNLDALVLALPGVVSLYATPSIARSARELVSAERGLVEVVQSSVDDAPDRISVSLGVDATAQAPVTAAAVASAIRATLPADAVTEIIVRISLVGG
jgi:hypothetical protein